MVTTFGLAGIVGKWYVEFGPLRCDSFALRFENVYFIVGDNPRVMITFWAVVTSAWVHRLPWWIELLRYVEGIQ